MELGSCVTGLNFKHNVTRCAWDFSDAWGGNQALKVECGGLDLVITEVIPAGSSIDEDLQKVTVPEMVCCCEGQGHNEGSDLKKMTVPEIV